MTDSEGGNQIMVPKVYTEEILRCLHDSHTCNQYADRKEPLNRSRAPLQPIGTGYLMQRLFFEMYSALLLNYIVDYFTKWLVVLSLLNMESQMIAKALMERYAAYFSALDQLHIDIRMVSTVTNKKDTIYRLLSLMQWVGKRMQLHSPGNVINYVQ
ncbi:hypothetical protein T4A_10832 [Trichinella pseudospiralis]|uniref:Uncharacterized protein n=1 Tax=Trichinella pseudospiralis TaxID=6337 RepID=A0A0V1EIQ7_TRIPS|nr:hypothetical protein T4A_10832 [Trichinella pseudospiralis]